MNTYYLATLGAFILAATQSIADDNLAVEEIIVINDSLIENSSANAPANNNSVDSASILKGVPGANVNQNGPLTGQAQYRGSYGNRINIVVDGGSYVTGGPNNMDTPLSNAPASLLKSMRVNRGVSSVSSGQETLGGHIEVTTETGSYSNQNSFDAKGSINVNYSSANQGTNTSLLTHISNKHHKFSLSESIDRGDDTEFGGDGIIKATEYSRNRSGLSYGFRGDTQNLHVSLSRNNTDTSGTPALPMDIVNIDGNAGNLKYTARMDDMEIKAGFSVSEVEHGMNNFSLRDVANPMMQRHTDADGQKLAYNVGFDLPIAEGVLSIGLDGTQMEHSATVSNPANEMFMVKNFNNTSKDIYGIYTQWRTENSQWSYELGLRYNQVTTDADEVSSTGMMDMMGMHAMTLANNFNNNERDKTHNNIDWVAKSTFRLNDIASLNTALARKSRSPLYQELYLWLPMQATAGLADGRSYIGNTELDSEVAHELNIGLNFEHDTFTFNPQIFYREVHDFIQGTSTTNMPANMLSNMMSGNPALQFNNIDAKFFGLDAGYLWQINESWHINGSLSYVRGQRTDTKDDLYRIAPLNGNLQINYSQNKYTLSVEGIAYAKQDKVATFNSEAETNGYGLVNFFARYEIAENLSLKAGINNIFDKRYQDHLAGYNRVNNSDIPLGQRIFGTGRNAYVQASYKL